MTKDELVTIASLVEREGRTNADRPIIAEYFSTVFGETGHFKLMQRFNMPLGINNGKNMVEKRLTDEDKKIESPYNTYRNPGLPLGPIANPGLEAINGN